VTPETKGDQVQEQLASLDIVLYFFSGIALFVGAFLILNSFNMTILQRTRELGTLRALGASRARVARSVLVEAILLGIAGSALGLAWGSASRSSSPRRCRRSACRCRASSTAPWPRSPPS